MCMTFDCSPQNNHCYIIRSMNLVNFCPTSIEAYRQCIRHWVSCERKLLQFYPYLLETLQLFLSRSEDVHVIWM